ncbi:alpha/beta-type small acid-soluble spore protein [Calorimonas adulescens]|jgi:Small, acid-soluble spore proteins, alpha/beta type.|uniref:Alpha/beta-type small acid-soluble spore protein n=1 Tax=Calorimonas adulescens TaxID=2606906 RepID=A0A5D8QFD4_9THEO|nr:alpha/beta-type small acid-soluble spore protein [Calorimonas adulescens]TZE83400.1 alpha/beta-type small acid-soluble spore protein [Calorimonas adulescens]
MARGSNTSNIIVVREAKKAMDQWKYEVANEIGVQPPADGYWGNLSSRDCGAVGGHMVRKMIEMAERSIANTPQNR